MLPEHVISNPPSRKILLLFALPLLTRAKTIVELGASLTSFPETYEDGSPWGVSSDQHEGLVSTRIFLSACYLLRQCGVAATLTSIDTRSDPREANAERLFSE